MAFPSFPRVDRLAGDVGQFVYNAVTPRTNEPSGAPGPQSTMSYLGDVAHALNPADPGSWLSYAAMMIPGGRGNGGLSPMAKLYLEQLHNVRGGGTIPRFENTNVRQGYTMAGNPGLSAGAGVVSKLDVQQSPTLRLIAEHLGHTYGSPNTELYINSGHTPTQTYNRLGLNTRDHANRFLSKISDPVDPNAQMLRELVARNLINRRN